MVTAETGIEHRVDAMPGEERFAAFGAAAVEHGVRSSRSVPLAGPSALNLYAATPAVRPDRVHAVATLLARCVSTQLSAGATAAPADPQAATGARAGTVARGGTAAWAGTAARVGARTDRAVRLVMAAEGLSRGDAFGRPARRSRDERRSLPTVVADVLAEDDR